ncbi:MAG TPA: hypothetical protein VF885_13135 [Arthrobacter sp.]
MTTPTPHLPIPEITPLEDRAIRRFEHDRGFYERCYAKARELKEDRPDDALGKRLQDAMRALQEDDETVHDDASIVRAATYLGNDLMGIRYPIASVQEQEALKTAVRNILAMMDKPL